MTETGRAITWPQRNYLFVAYQAAPIRIGGPGGHPLTVRPQVWVIYFDSIVVQNLIKGGRSGDANTVTVEFDPASAGLDYKIAAYLNPNDPQVAVLEAARDSGTPVRVAIEKHRRKRTPGPHGEHISPLTHIHALRGRSRTNGDDPNVSAMRTADRNIRTSIAVVQDQVTSEIVSDPAEWSMLLDNRSGDLSPEGWRVPTELADPNDWTTLGVVVPETGSLAKQQTSTGPTDPHQALEHISQLLEQHLGKGNDARATGTNAQATTGEGMPWHVRTSDGAPNLGSYLMSKERGSFEWAYEYLAARTDSPDLEQVWSLSQRMLQIADHVQAGAYGHSVADRTVKSHYEASMWVNWVAEHSSYPADDTDDDLTAWQNTVTEHATTLFSRASRNVQAQLTPPHTDEQPDGPDLPNHEPSASPLLRSALTAVERAVQDGKAQSVYSLAGSLKNRDLHNELVAMQRVDDGVRLRVVGDGQAPSDEWHVDAVNKILKTLYHELSTGDEASAPSEDDPDQKHDDASEMKQQAQDYSEEVKASIAQLESTTTLTGLRAVYTAVRDNNLLDEPVSVRNNGDRVEFGPCGATGYARKPLSEVIDAFRAALPDENADPSSSADVSDTTMAYSPQDIADNARTAAETGSTDDLDTWHIIADSHDMLQEQIHDEHGLTGPLEIYFHKLRDSLETSG